VLSRRVPIAHIGAAKYFRRDTSPQVLNVPSVLYRRFDFTFTLIFWYGLKYSVVYPATSHANTAKSAAAINLITVIILRSII
jgi:hypothetical protein